MQFRHCEATGRRKTPIASIAAIALACLTAPVSANMRQEVSELRMACETGDSAACLTLGRAYETRRDLWGQPVRGDGVKRNDARAVYYFRQGCNLNNAKACRDLSRLYETGKGVAEDKIKARQLSLKACVLRGGQGCSRFDGLRD